MKKLITALVILCQLGLGILAPGMAAQAASGELAWAAPSKRLLRHTYDGMVNVPLYDPEWNTISQIKFTDRGVQDVRMYNGPEWITRGLKASGMAGLTNDQIGGAITSFANTSGAIVYGRYSPELHQLRVNVVRLFRNEHTNIIDVQERPYTPVDGRWFVKAQKFLTQDELLNRKIAGNDPFVGMSSDYTDPVFYNVASVGDAMVIMGLASQYSGVIKGIISLLAVDATNVTQSQSSSGSWFRKTVTTKVDAYTKPQWFVGLPKDQQPNGFDPSFCVKQLTSCDAKAHLAFSGLAWRQWSGGNMPETLDHIYHWETSTSSWTLGAFMVVVALATMVVTAGASGVLAMAQLAEFIGANAITVGIAAGATYGAVGLAVGGGGLTMTQSNVGYGNIGRNLAPAQTPNGEVQTGINNAIQNGYMAANPANSISGVKTAYAGNCPTQYTARQCWNAGLDPGHILRADVYTEINGVLLLRDRYEWCKNVGWTGRDLNRCAAGAIDGNHRDIYGSYIAPRLSPDDAYIINTYYATWPN